MRMTVNEVSPHLYNLNTNYNQNIPADRREATSLLSARLLHVTALLNLLKLRKPYINVQKTHLFPNLDLFTRLFMNPIYSA